MRNAQLDILRTIAVLLVVLSHLPAAPITSPVAIVAMGGFFRTYGGMGVDLFFVLSGFLVSGLLFREYLSCGRARIGRFLVRRAFKIYPPFYVFLVFTVLLRLRLGDVLTRADVVSEALFVQNYGAHVWSHTWSLAVEEHFYILLAIIVLGLQRQVRRDGLAHVPLIFLGTAAVVTMARWVTFTSFPPSMPYSNAALRFPTHLQIDSLFFGVLMSYYFHTKPLVADAVRRRRRWLFVGGLLSVVGSQLIPNATVRYVVGHILAYLGFGAVVIAAVCTALPVRGRRLMESVAFLGTHSYSIYLWHAAVLAIGRVLAVKLLGRAPGYYELAFAYIAGSFAWGVVTARCVEWPALALRERLYSERPAAAKVSGDFSSRTRLAAVRDPAN